MRLGVGLALVLGGCTVGQESVRRDASFQMNCPVEQITLTDLGDDRLGVSGCGGRMVFIWVNRVGYMAESGTLRGGSTAARTPPPEDFLFVPLHVVVLEVSPPPGGTAAPVNVDVSALLGQLNAVYEPAGIFFVMDAPATIARGATSAEAFTTGRAGPPADGLRLFLVHVSGEAMNNGAALGGRDVLVQDAPRLKEVAGPSVGPVARVAGHVLGSVLGLRSSTDERQLMAQGTTGIAIDTAQANGLRSTAVKLPGTRRYGEVAAMGLYPDAVKAIVQRAHDRATPPAAP